MSTPNQHVPAPRASLDLDLLNPDQLDAVVHRRDLPLLPGGPPVAGFGLWRNPPAAAAVELGLVIAGSVLYARSIRSRLPALAVFASGAITLALNYAGF